MKIEDTKKRHSKYMSIILTALLVVNLVLVVLLVRNISEKRRLEAQFSNQTNDVGHVIEEVNIIIPETIYVAKGITMEIYNSQVTSLGEDITKYNILWECEVGENLERKFSITADETNLGTYELTLKIYDNQLQLVTEEKCTLELAKEDVSQKELASSITKLSEVPAECLAQVKVCVDTVYNGTLEKLKSEGWKQMQDVIYSVLCGLGNKTV